MDNVIRPTFGSSKRVSLAPAQSDAQHTRGSFHTLHSYGKVAGHIVALLRDEGNLGGKHRVVIGSLSGGQVTTLATVEASPEGEIEAERAALAALRALEFVAAQAPSAS